ncbi:MAG: extracellular solute-binding protein, partial [Chloroflexi bacterium]|nr:extracellular solute-binding protein [Chloroflexota bacterium]
MQKLLPALAVASLLAACGGATASPSASSPAAPASVAAPASSQAPASASGSPAGSARASASTPASTGATTSSSAAPSGSAPASASAATSAGAQGAASVQGAPSSAEFQKVLAAAKQEGEVICWCASPLRETFNQLMPAFNKRFGTDIKLTLVNVAPVDLATRIITESKQPKATGDLAWIGVDTLLPLQQANALPSVDWQTQFGSELPAVKDRMTHMPGPWKNAALETYDQTFGLMYNTQLIKKEDLPKKWQDLGDPKWSGKFLTDPSGMAYGRLRESLGDAEVLSIAQKIKANKPIFGQASGDISQKVVAGQALFGTGNAETVNPLKAQGAPIEKAYMDPVAFLMTTYVPLVNAPHPSAGHLFAAWMATEGQKQ